MKPFKITFSENIPKLLQKLNCSLVLSTYKANTIIAISTLNGEDLFQLKRSFDEPMGIAIQNENLAIANFNTIQLYVNFPNLVKHHNGKKNNFDSVYYPRKTFYSNNLDIHDLAFGANGEILGVSSSFSCIARLDTDFHFEAIWQPNFISNLVPEDKCHLNGMALANGIPKYATAFSAGDTKQSWRENITTSGVLIDIERNEILIEKLGMPHSPKLFTNDKGEKVMFYIESAKSRINIFNLQNKKNEIFYEGSHFFRGMEIYENYLFVASSKLRVESTTSNILNISDEANWAGVLIFDLKQKKQIGFIKYLNTVNEIYDIKILNKKSPNILTTERNSYKQGIATKDEVFFK